MTTNQRSPRAAGSLRILARLGWRLRGTPAPALALDVLEEEVVHMTATVATAATTAGDLDIGLAATKALLRAALTDAATPGIIDDNEAALIARHLSAHRVDARTTATNLRNLL